MKWIEKLTSRKLWVAVAAFVSGLIIAFKGDAEVAETVSGIILQGAAVLGYLLAEGLVDAKAAEGATGILLPEAIDADELKEYVPPDDDAPDVL